MVPTSVVRAAPPFVRATTTKAPYPAVAVGRLVSLRLANPRLYSTATPPKPASRLRRTLGFTSLAVVAFFAGLSVAPFQAANKIMAVGIPTDEETLALFQPVDELSQRIDEHIKTHALAQQLRSQPDFVESRPHLKIPETLRDRNLTAGTLAGPDRIVVPPYVWSEKSGKELVSISYLGGALSGHPGIVHGGLLATMLDEGFARCCFPALPNRVGVTANLNIDYRQPVMADNYVVLRATTVKVEGRKAWVEGRLETLPEGDEEPVVLVEAKALFIEPKFASKLPSIAKTVA